MKKKENDPKISDTVIVNCGTSQLIVTVHRGLEVQLQATDDSLSRLWSVGGRAQVGVGGQKNNYWKNRQFCFWFRWSTLTAAFQLISHSKSRSGWTLLVSTQSKQNSYSQEQLLREVRGSFTTLLPAILPWGSGKLVLWCMKLRFFFTPHSVYPGQDLRNRSLQAECIFFEAAEINAKNKPSTWSVI